MGCQHLQEHGETDALLTMAYHHMEAMECPCCGHPIHLAHDEDTEGRWGVEVVTCHAGAALESVRSKHRDDLEPGQMLTVKLLPEGVEASDPLAFDPARAAEEYQKNLASLGLAPGVGETDPDEDEAHR